MKRKLLHYLFFFAFFLRSISGAAQVVNMQDSLALVDLYNSTTGSGWTNHTNWLTTASVSGWYGVTTLNGRVTQLSLAQNNLTGTLPASLGNLSAMVYLALDQNQLSGSLPGSITSLPLAALILRFNQLSGNIPAALGSIPGLTVLQLNNNQFTGSIPISLASNTALNVLDLSVNQLTGSIPGFSNLPVLTVLNVGSNRLSGSLPALSNLSLLGLLNVQSNQLSGTIPASYAHLPQLEVFWADHNQLSGSIPDSFCYQHFVSMLLNSNRLTGKLPDSIGKLTNLVLLDLDNNQLSGPVPASISRLVTVPMTLNNNAFTFAGIANLKPITNCTYAPQANIPLVRQSDSLYVTAGGVTASEQFSLYKDGVLQSTKTGDSAFKISATGKYNIVSTDADASLLTLYSDTLTLGLVLPTSTCSADQTVSGVAVDVISGIFKLVTLAPGAAANGLSGDVAVLETIDPVVSALNGQPYVHRHYDITPVSNAAEAQATVTLYFSQADFDAFNSYVTGNKLSIPLLPSGGTDNGNVRVNQFHGTFTGSASPANYKGAAVLITPVVSWDVVNGWWTVTFPVSGFSGFYLSTGIVPLPLTLLQFTGVPQGKAVVLQWKTIDELNTSQYIVERGSDGTVFSTIGTVPAKDQAGENDYGFTDGQPLAGNNFYRLRMTNMDGSFTYSPIVSIQQSVLAGAYFVYPNPVRGLTSVLFNAGAAGKYTMQVIDPLGRLLQVLNGVSVAGANKVDIDMGACAAGIYTIVISDPVMGRRSLRVTKE
jgi:hypothetical protein